MCNYLSCPKDLLLSAQILIAVSPLVSLLCDEKCASCWILLRMSLGNWSSCIWVVSMDLTRLKHLEIQLDQCGVCNFSLSNLQWLPWTCAENHGAAGHFSQNISQGKSNLEIQCGGIKKKGLRFLIVPFITIDVHLWDFSYSVLTARAKSKPRSKSLP